MRGDEVVPGADAELDEDVPEVGLDGLDADVQLGCRGRRANISRARAAAAG